MRTSSLFLIFTVVFSLSVKAQHFGSALRFDGVDDYVDMGNASTFDVGTAITYEAWINPDTSLSGIIFNKWVGFLEDKQFFSAGNRIHFYLFDVFGGLQLTSSPSVPTHQYTHVAATYDGSTARLYINGVFDTSKVVGSGVSNSHGSLYYGSNPSRGDLTAPFKGIIDEVRIWDIVRSESEIQSTMHQTLDGNEPGLVGYWKFDEGMGTITYDSTSNDNDGTISGATWVISGVVSVAPTDSSTPERFALAQNYPNPFNPATTISYQLPVASHVALKIYNILGQQVATLVDGLQEAGYKTQEWDARDRASGIYLYRLSATGTGSGHTFTSVKRMTLLR